MEPQKNVNPATSDEDKNIAPQTGVNESTDAPITSSEDTTMADTSVTSPQDDNAASTTPDVSVGTQSDDTTDVALGGDAQPTSGDADVSTPQQPVDTDMSAAPEVTPSEAPAPGAAMPSADSNPDFQSPLGGTTVTPGDTSTVPPTVPVPASHGDKKTVVVLIGVAVVLLVAIAVLYFFV